MKSPTVLLIAIFAAGLGLAGCDAGDDPGAPATTASAGTDRQQLLSLGQEWVKCLRDHGLTRMPDAELSTDGYLQFAASDGYNWKEDLRNRQSVIDACQPIEDRYPPNAFRPKEQVSADDLRKLAEFAKCVRAHGLPDFPDPNQAGEFDLSGTPLANGIPANLRDQAEEACKSIWSGGVKITGGSGVKK
ncbi:hypothetical protein ACFQS1_03410 [Paractinoplanes rhizophilus]|uniref:Lipoprotein n=1 Tax=Paractinoplanes rhizophilus TaxID=1416877 RepID=A0ABW2HND0_9ACTN